MIVKFASAISDVFPSFRNVAYKDTAAYKGNVAESTLGNVFSIASCSLWERWRKVLCVVEPAQLQRAKVLRRFIFIWTLLMSASSKTYWGEEERYVVLSPITWHRTVR